MLSGATASATRRGLAPVLQLAAVALWSCCLVTVHADCVTPCGDLSVNYELGYQPCSNYGPMMLSGYSCGAGCDTGGFPTVASAPTGTFTCTGTTITGGPQCTPGCTEPLPPSYGAYKFDTGAGGAANGCANVARNASTSSPLALGTSCIVTCGSRYISTSSATVQSFTCGYGGFRNLKGWISSSAALTCVNGCPSPPKASTSIDWTDGGGPANGSSCATAVPMVSGATCGVRCQPGYVMDTSGDYRTDGQCADGGFNGPKCRLGCPSPALTENEAIDYTNTGGFSGVACSAIGPVMAPSVGNVVSKCEGSCRPGWFWTSFSGPFTCPAAGGVATGGPDCRAGCNNRAWDALRDSQGAHPEVDLDYFDNSIYPYDQFSCTGAINVGLFPFAWGVSCTVVCAGGGVGGSGAFVWVPSAREVELAVATGRTLPQVQCLKGLGLTVPTCLPGCANMPQGDPGVDYANTTGTAPSFGPACSEANKPFVLGSTCVAGCASGYYLDPVMAAATADSSSFTCAAGGSWTGGPSCLRGCMVPSSSSDASLNYSTTVASCGQMMLQGDSCPNALTCAAGFELTTGSFDIACDGTDGTLSGGPTCTLIPTAVSSSSTAAAAGASSSSESVSSSAAVASSSSTGAASLEEASSSISAAGSAAASSTSSSATLVSSSTGAVSTPSYSSSFAVAAIAPATLSSSVAEATGAATGTAAALAVTSSGRSSSSGSGYSSSSASSGTEFENAACTRRASSQLSLLMIISVLLTLTVALRW